MKTATMFGAAMMAAILSLAGAANASSSSLKAATSLQISKVLTDPAVISAINAQNARHQGMDQAKIDALDKQWRSEIGQTDAPLIDSMMTSDLSALLVSYREKSEGLFSEIFAMDMFGLNVGASDITSDYWQGDEEKWQETFLKGAKATHYDDVEFDESTQQYLTQVSVTIADPATGEPIGAITFGVNMELVE